MEPVDKYITQENSNGFNDEAKSHLLAAAKWANFLAILGYIGIGFMVLAAFTSIFTVGQLEGNVKGLAPMWSSLVLIFVFVIYFFPIYYLQRFARHAIQAINMDEAFSTVEAMRYLKQHYRYVGILMIVVLSLYLCLFLFTIIF